MFESYSLPENVTDLVSYSTGEFTLSFSAKDVTHKAKHQSWKAHSSRQPSRKWRGGEDPSTQRFKAKD